ncbi:MAG TPA: hypothetical protein VNS34_04190 [Rhizobiaceae bacterium]|nr:hypothetical protein [Rhizobiaceae bacterium]
MDLKQGHTPLIVSECLKRGILRNQCAYILATAWHETGQYRYMREIWGPTAAQKRYEGRTDLGNVVAGDGKKFMGRGFVQITGRRNYADWSRRLGLDLLEEPQLAERPDIAVRILVEGMTLGTFTGRKLEDFVDLRKSDYVSARRVVNGTDRADLLAGHAREFEAALKDARYGVDDASPAPSASKPKKPEGKGILATLLRCLVSLFRKGA